MCGGGYPIIPGNKNFKYDDLIRHYATRFSIPFHIAKALIGQESTFNANAKSPCGAMGLCQLMPATARELNVLDPSDPEENIRGGMQHLAAMYSIFKLEKGIERWLFALGAYNCGAGYVIKAQRIAKLNNARTDKWYHIVLFLKETGCDYRQTSEYVARILWQMFNYTCDDIKIK